MDTTLGYIRKETNLQKLVGSKFFWAVFAGFLFSYPIYRSYYRELPPELPVHFNLPSYELTNEFGKPFGSKNLDGKIYLVTFAKASCTGNCPDTMKLLQQIQKRMKGVKKESAMITITFDPGKDDPERLGQFARSLDANPFFWNFLTGDEIKLKRLLSNGFRIEKTVESSYEQKLFLVDRRNKVRGLYTINKNSINQLMIDVGLLINRDQLYK